MTKTFSLVLLLMFNSFLFAAPQNPAKELGSVKWKRDLNAAKKTSAESGKPLMLLFQEVPG